MKKYKDEYKKLYIKKNLKGEEALKAVQKNGYTLEYVQEQTEAICLAAVQQNSDA